MFSSHGAHLDYLFLQSQHGHRCRNLDNAVCYLLWVDFYSCSWRVSISLISTGTNMLCCINLYRFFTIFTVWGMPTSSKSSPILYNSQYSNYSDSNTSWTPSEVPSGTSTTTSAIKIGEVTFFFRPSARPPPSDPWVGILVPPPPWWFTSSGYGLHRLHCVSGRHNAVSKFRNLGSD